MKSHKEIYYINSKKEIIFNVIANIQNYPTFLPWCIGARIIETKNVSDVIVQNAELIISFKSSLLYNEALLDISDLVIGIRLSSTSNSFILSSPLSFC